MGRELKRVPLDFDCPLNKVWKGYINPFEGVKVEWMEDVLRMWRSEAYAGAVGAVMVLRLRSGA
jgi:hypothetical protein